MDSSKAKKAKSTAKKAKARRSSASQESMEKQMLMQAAMAGSINPEIQAPAIAMQNQTQAVNPYGRMGTMAPNLYNPGNVVTNY